MAGLMHRLDVIAARILPEQRLFLRSDTETRFIRLSPFTQLVAVTGTTLLVAWAIIASAILAMDTIGSGSLRDQAKREQKLYETRLLEMAAERDFHVEEAQSAQERFEIALSDVSKMQSQLLASQNRLEELERGISVIQRTLQRTVDQRDAANTKLDQMAAELSADPDAPKTELERLKDLENTLAFLTDALQSTATERDVIALDSANAQQSIKDLQHERLLDQDKSDRILSQLEDALTVSVQPLNDMFQAVGLNADNLIDQVRQGYSGQGGPLTPISLSTKTEDGPIDPLDLRAQTILNKMDRLNLYRIAAEKVPFGMPVKSSFRYTSGFGPRWGRMHNGTDFASSTGTPIYATADGVVIHADWLSGYGRLIKIQHEFGIETRYAHLAKIRVKVGQRVSRGDRIGDMGNSGRSTGTHLHYEVRVGGKPINPMTYIKAARNVF